MGLMVWGVLMAGCGGEPNVATAPPVAEVKPSSSGLPALPPYEVTEVRGETEPLGTPSAMGFFCRYTDQDLVLESLQSSGTSARDRFFVVLDMRAREESIDGWAEFRASYLALEQSDRTLWLGRNIAKHKLQGSCKHLLSGGPLNASMGDG